MDPLLYAPDGQPWCRFGPGTAFLCLNGDGCRNIDHTDADGNFVPGYHKPDYIDPWEEDMSKIKRDRWGRPILPDPETGKERAWTRVTTAAKTMEDQHNLIDWKARMVAYGVGQREDLQALAAGADGTDDKGTLNDVVEQAVVVAQASSKANVGNALHGLTQKIDRGDATVMVPKNLRDHITRYKTLIDAHGIQVRKEMIERLVCIPELGLAGSMDRGVEWQSILAVSDLKTGSLDYARVSIAQQLAAYANGTHWWDIKAGCWREQPEMNKDVALVVWLPAEGETAKVYKVDIAEGWKLLQASLDIRTIRSGKGTHLFEEVTAEALPAPAAIDEARLRRRVKRIQEAGGKAALLALWRKDVPSLKEGGLSDEHIVLWDSWCEQVEREVGLA